MATRVDSQAENMLTPAKTHQPSSISKVRVIVRVRPFLSHEISSRNENPISCISTVSKESESFGDEVTVLLKDQETSRNECYKLDGFYEQEDNNVYKIFEREVNPLIEGIFQGYNSTVFAYGATGSGKTYTMQGNDQLHGLMPLAVSNILLMCNYTGSSVTISYYEIYLNRCYDLLEPKKKEIMVMNDKDKEIHLMGLSQIEVKSMFDFHETFSSVLQRRKVAHTGLNDVSSRSHAVLAISVSTPSNDSVVTGKLNLIDLAGNEDNRRTCNEGIHLQESAKINQSLFALSNVIYALNNNKPRIPYRESKLTRILQNSLGGTSRALMVACLNPGEYQESVHTVSLAARSRHVSNFVSPAQRSSTSKVKIDMESKLLAWLESKGKSKNAPRTPFTGKTPGSVCSSRKWNTSPCFSENKAVRNIDVSSSKQRTTSAVGRGLFSVRDHADQSQKEAKDSTYGDTIVEMSTIHLETSLHDESMIGDEEPTIDKLLNVMNLSPVNEKIKEILSSHRKILSPIDSNTNRTDLVHLDPKTPKRQLVSSNNENSLEMFDTPLDKFTTKSSNLQSSLVQNYIEFLNTASREELLELKGIGERIAKYIIELRETSPLKSLSDIEKIGLSSKQVQNMFGRAARGVFEKMQ